MSSSLSTEIRTAEKNLDAVQVPASPRHREPTPLEAIIETIRRDSRMESESYLNETVAPHGGE